ncbi:hypothetical protein EcWSU1_02671 [Enterobacter ludwigii]|uniref:Uncharacterized protein n=1 Tax=Enterobacter ludwigii TaxID=299767 RepID=G8LFB9_9ENTR|nr:hypothetical protein EcWSU1_02671 [Enterobacter ludwigii]
MMPGISPAKAIQGYICLPAMTKSNNFAPCYIADENAL